MTVAARTKRYRLVGEMVFRDVDASYQRLPGGTELGPRAMASFSPGEIEIHVREGRFVPVVEPRRGLVERARSLVVRTS